MTCKVCGLSESDYLFGTKWRPVIGDKYRTEPLCWGCFVWQCSIGRIVTIYDGPAA